MRKKKKNPEEDFWKDIKKSIDEGYRYFWKKRGYDEPPSTQLGKFGNMIFGKGSKMHHKEK